MKTKKKKTELNRYTFYYYVEKNKKKQKKFVKVGLT